MNNLNDITKTLGAQTKVLNSIIERTNSSSSGYHENVTTVANNKDTIIKQLVENAHKMATYSYCNLCLISAIIALIILLLIVAVYKRGGDHMDD